MSIIAGTYSRLVEASQLISTTVPVIINVLDADLQDHKGWTGNTSSKLVPSQDQAGDIQKEGSVIGLIVIYNY